MLGSARVSQVHLGSAWSAGYIWVSWVRWAQSDKMGPTRSPRVSGGQPGSDGVSQGQLRSPGVSQGLPGSDFRLSK